MRFSMLAHFRFVIFLAAMYLCGIVAAQGVDRGSDYYRSQYVRLHKAYLKDTNDVENLVNLSRFYSDERNPMFSLPFARGYLNRADSRYRFMLSGNEHDRELRRLINRGITLRSLDEAKKHLSRQAVLKLSSEELSLVEVDQFLEAFSDDKAVLKQAGIQRVKSAYRSVLRQNTIAAYVAFVKQYPGTDESRSAERHVAMLVDSLYDGSSDVSQADAYLKAYDDNPEVRRSVMRHHAEFAFKSACRDNTIEAYRSFVDNYPSSNHSIIALHRIDSLSELSLGSIQSPKGYVDFALANPGSELADRAIDELFRKVMDENNVQAARLFMKHFDDDPRYVDVYKRYYEWYSQEACYPLIDTFAHAHPDYPFRSSLNGDLNEAADIESLNLERPFDEARIWNYKELVKSFPSKRIAYVALQRMLQNLIATSNWPDALERCRTFEGRFQGYNKIAYDTLLSLLSSPFDAARLPVDYLVSSDVDITSSAVAPSGKALYFTSRTSSSLLYSAILKGGKWTHVAPFSIEGAPEGALSVFSLFDNGNKMLLGSAGDILVAAYDGSRWRVSEVLPYPVNTDFVETDAFMLPDGSGLLFASDRPLGYNVQPSGMHYHGDTALASDLYFVPFNTAGWGEPINLGFRVNSCYCERYPVLSRDLKTLYFVSDCGGGLGYGDIYVSHRSSIDDWQGWSHPRNLGKEVNSAFAESSLSLSPNGGKLCFTSSRPGAQGHLFVATVEAQASSAYSTLRISDDSDGLVNCRVFDLATNAEVRVDYDGTSRSVILCNGHTYAVSFVQKDRWRPMFTVRGGDKTELRASGNTPSELEGRTCPLSFIVLDRHDSKLTSLARVEIEQLAHFLQKNPSLLIDIVVDCPGKNTAQCHEQSVAIGESVRSAVVDSGVSIDRISVVGRGNLESHASGHNAVFVRFRTR